MSNFTEILIRTPLWVWPVFAALVWVGWARTRTREVSARRLMIAPVVFGTLLLARLVASGFAPTPLSGAAVGLVVGGFAVSMLKPARSTARLADGRLLVEGEWISLAMIVIVFGANYAFNVAAAINPAAAASPVIQFAIALATGFSAGFTILRTLAHLQVGSTAPARL